MFCVPSEIACKIRSLEDLQSDEPILVSNVIAWAISGTMNDLRRSIALWASQGRRHIKHRKIWNRTRTDESFSLTLADAKEFLEQEALTLSERYSSSNGGMAAETDNSDDEIELCRIHDNLVYFGGDDSPSATFHEEQERELAPEIEQERQVEGPRPATAERNHLHNDVMSFARTGKLRTASEAFLPAFDILQNTSAAKVYQGVSFPKGILVTKDFATTIESRLTLGDLDSYQRSVQWIVTSLDPEGSKVGIMLIISPYEAYRILSVVRKERKVTLHIYAPRQTEESTCLDHLSLFTEGRPFLNVGIPDSFVIQLGLFAGQVYFDSYKAYCDSCDYLGLRWNVSGKRNSVDGDGFIVNGPSGSAFDKSPIEILKILMYRVRRHGQDIGKTHLGKMLGGRILDVALFDRATSEEYQSI